MIDTALPPGDQLFNFCLSDKTLLKKPSVAVGKYHGKKLDQRGAPEKKCGKGSHGDSAMTIVHIEKKVRGA